MKILFKYLLKNLWEKKLRSFLVLFSIALTAALFFASLAITDTVGKINLDLHRAVVGNADIRIFGNESNSKSPYIEVSEADVVADETEYIMGVINGRALYAPNVEDMMYTNVLGTTLEDLAARNPITFDQSDDLEPFVGNKIIISKVTADKLDLLIGSEMELEFGDRKELFKVVGISNLEGIFLGEGTTSAIIMPKSTLADIYVTEGRVNNIFIKLKDSKRIEQVIEKLASAYADCEVTEALDSSDLQESMTEVQMPLKLVTVLVILMSVFIIYTSFKVISLERLPILGTFRSIGATKRNTCLLLSLESLFFGTMGGLLGSLLGVFALYIIISVMASDGTGGSNIIPSYKNIYLLYTFIFAIALSYFSALAPVYGTSKFSTKDIILNNTNKDVKNSKKIPILATVLLGLAILIPKVIPKSPLLVLIVDDTCIALILVALIMLIPTIISLFIPLLERVFVIFGFDSRLAVKNLKNNRSINNIIALLVIGISTLILITSINESMIDKVVNVYSNTIKYDIMLNYRQSDEAFLWDLGKIEGVDGVTATIEQSRIEIIGRDYTMNWVYGIDTENYFQYWNIDLTEDTQKRINELNQGRNVIIGTAVEQKLDLEIGDCIKLDFGTGQKEYKIIGFTDTSWNSSNIALISRENLMTDGGYTYFTDVYVNTGADPIEIQKVLRQKYLKDLLYISTADEQLFRNTDGINAVFIILKSYSQLTMLIGVLGIINNLIVSFIERKKVIAIYRSVGMSKGQLKKMLMLESLVGGILGGFIGLGAAALMLDIMPDIMEQIMMKMKMSYSPRLFLGYFVVAIAVMVIASIIPALKSSKLGIIETIKYE